MTQFFSTSLTIRICSIIIGLPIFITLYTANTYIPVNKQHFNIHGQSIRLPTSPDAILLIENVLIVTIIGSVALEVFLYLCLCGPFRRDPRSAGMVRKSKFGANSAVSEAREMNARLGSTSRTTSKTPQTPATTPLSPQAPLPSQHSFLSKHLSCFSFIISPFVLWTSIAYDIAQKACNALLQYSIIPSRYSTISDPFSDVSNIDTFTDSAIAPSFSNHYIAWGLVRLLNVPTWLILIEIIVLFIGFGLALSALFGYICYEDLMLLPVQAGKALWKWKHANDRRRIERLTNKVVLINGDTDDEDEGD